MAELTPMMKQYFQIKDKYKDCILFYRMGDFYEMFYEDAEIASAVLDIVLTSRGKNKMGKTPLCGFPYHAAENYIGKMVKAGYKVAICEQIEDPATAKGVVKRDVIKVVTAGTYIDDNSTDSRYLLSLCLNDKNNGLAFIDATGGAIFANAYNEINDIAAIISKLPVFECVYAYSDEDKIKELFNSSLLKNKNVLLSPHDDYAFNAEIAHKALCDHFGTHSLDGFGIDDKIPEIASAAGALLDYSKLVNKQDMQHIDKMKLYNDSDYVYISPAACYGLEMEILSKTLDKTTTALGKRMFKRWIYNPLKDLDKILERQDAVTLLFENDYVGDELKSLLKNTPDIEKNLSKISCGSTHARDMLALRNTLVKIPDIQGIVKVLEDLNPLFKLSDIKDLRELLDASINPEVPMTNFEGKVVKAGYCEELDSYRQLQTNAKEWLAKFQLQEKEKTGINTLKIGFNKVFGYYIEISKSNQKLVPETYIRKQTLVNAERYITEELKEFEEKMLSADSKVAKLEKEILEKIQIEIIRSSEQLHEFAEHLGTLDCLLSLSFLAQQNGYIAPKLNDTLTIDIKDGRHPIVEDNITEQFIPNDSLLDCDENHLLILTGPNMAGKSTYIRQTAVLVIMAQMGSYIPATSATIGLVDKIFTRIGAHDEITKGQSTFMVEMSEAADILNNLSERSLVILDEIGRGTSTYDGLSLAWAIAEYLNETKVRALFATHFHELTALSKDHKGVKNYNVAIKEWNDEIIFLHKIQPGGTDESYGIYVAKLAGIPKAVVRRSKEVLVKLEVHGNLHEKILDDKSNRPEAQLSLFNAAVDTKYDELKAKIEDFDINNMTPLEALNTLNEIKTWLE